MKSSWVPFGINSKNFIRGNGCKGKRRGCLEGGVGIMKSSHCHNGARRLGVRANPFSGEKGVNVGIEQNVMHRAKSSNRILIGIFL